MKTKFVIIKDSFGEVKGYRLGNHYLMKFYTWANDYTWIINITGQCSYYDDEFWKLYDKGEVEIVSNCRDGKARLEKLEGVM